MSIDFTWIEDEADRLQLMTLWESDGDSEIYWKAYDAVWERQGGKGTLNSHQPNPNEDYYGDSKTLQLPA